ncbi:MAG: hypothetical protein ABIS26_01815, partial [Candidatus Paceibacterota bacterium]
MKIVTVIPLAKGITLTDLTYFTSKEIPSGSIVTVPIRNKKTLGLVVSVEDVSEAKKNIKEMNFNLKKIIDVKDGTIFSREYLYAVIEAGKYFISSKNTAVTSLIPALFREKYDEILKFSKKFSEEKNPTIHIKENKKNIRVEKFLLQASREDRISTYKTLIRGSFADKKSIYIIFPSEREIENFREHLSRGIEQFTFVMHSGLSSKKILEAVENIITLDHSTLVLCT